MVADERQWRVQVPEDSRFESDLDELDVEPPAALDDDWTIDAPDPANLADLARLTHLLRAHERHGRGGGSFFQLGLLFFFAFLELFGVSVEEKIHWDFPRLGA